MKLKATRLFNKQQLVRVGKNWCLSTILFFTLPIALVEAQIIPDESLSTNTEQQGENRLNINGGEREGNNLFHSFEEFSIPEGLEAVFENAPDIENIFTRITGEEASAINGILRTQGGANLFLVNPNGIIFGENAQLDVGGSFIATTADSIQFEDGTEFPATGAENEPILTVSVPIGLQFEGNN
ncbi:MAG: filamentous hemagglutinin N-terminal domain-containing protein, partial [Waterburya sp.]